jgi:putative tryptophan/tyrosine transport system substrate-binding protein
MKRRALLAFAAAMSLLGTRFALAGPAAGVRRIDILLSEGSCEENRKFAADRFEELAKLGYVEGKNLVVGWHCFAGDFTLGARMAEEIVRRGTDVIFTIGTPATRMLRNATTTIPIVTWVADPVASGLTKKPCSARQQHHWIQRMAPGHTSQRDPVDSPGRAESPAARDHR